MDKLKTSYTNGEPWLVEYFNTTNTRVNELIDAIEEGGGGGSGGISDAPSDGQTYARKDGAWVVTSTQGMTDEEKAQLQQNTSDIADIKTKNETQDENIQANTNSIAANSALIKSLQESGLPTGAEYSFSFLEESAMDGLTKDNTTENILYFGLEEDESSTTTHITYDNGYGSADFSYDGGYVSVSGAVMDNGFVSV